MEPLLRAVDAQGYSEPTPVQAAVIPPMLAGRDVVGVAQTGTGKTAAFVLPILHRLAEDAFKPNKKTARVLILAPTRELAAQVEKSVKTYARFMALSTTLIVGGARLMPQIKSLAFGTDIAVATPGRLEDLMRSGAIRLDATTTVVLDEADQMMDLGFMPAIRRIMEVLPRERQVLLLSATMPKPIRALANDFLTDPAELELAPQSSPADMIKQTVRYMDRMEKRDALTDLLQRDREGQAIVFARTKFGADKLADHLERAGLNARAIHGDKHQSQRERILRSFRSGRLNILIATDVAARGIDVDDVTLVVNYELPNVAEAYIHRIGRTGRAGRAGEAVAFVDREERILLRGIERLTGEIAVDGPNPFKKDPMFPQKRKKNSRGKGQKFDEARKPRERRSGGGQGHRGRRPSGEFDPAVREDRGERKKEFRRGPREDREGNNDRRFDRGDRSSQSDRRDRSDRGRDYDRKGRGERKDDTGRTSRFDGERPQRSSRPNQRPQKRERFSGEDKRPFDARHDRRDRTDHRDQERTKGKPSAHSHKDRFEKKTGEYKKADYKKKERSDRPDERRRFEGRTDDNRPFQKRRDDKAGHKQRDGFNADRGQQKSRRADDRGGKRFAGGDGDRPFRNNRDQENKSNPRKKFGGEGREGRVKPQGEQPRPRPGNRPSDRFATHKPVFKKRGTPAVSDRV